MIKIVIRKHIVIVIKNQNILVKDKINLNKQNECSIIDFGKGEIRMRYMSDYYENSNTMKLSNDNFRERTYCSIVKKNSVNAKYEVICFNKKKKISYYKMLENNQIQFEADKIMNSYMVVIRARENYKPQIIKMLGEICAAKECFAPIVSSKNADIIFFPKLKYQDGYLIKSILENEYHKQYQVAYGNQDMIVI